MLGCDTRDLLAEAPRPRADDLPPHRHAVRAGHRSRELEPVLERRELAVEMRVEGQLALEDRRRYEDDPGSAVGSEPAGEVEGVLRLLPVEQRHDDGAITDRARPAREAPGAAVEEAYVRQLHRMSW